MGMISGRQLNRILNQLNREESKIVNIVLKGDVQVAGEIAEANSQGIVMSDGRRYLYRDIREINGLYG